MTQAKRMQPAFAARNVIAAVRLAHKGVTGPHRALEGEFGLFRTYCRQEPPPVRELLRRPEDPWRIEHISIKPYTSCGACHSLIAAALRLATTHDLDPAQVERVEIHWGASGKNVTVGQPFRLAPTNPLHDHFAGPARAGAWRSL